MPFFDARFTGCHPCHLALLSQPLYHIPSSVSRGHTPPASFLPESTMFEHSSPSRDSPSPTPEATRGRALRQGPLPMFQMDVVQSYDALEAADVAVRAPDPALSDLCDAVGWTAVDGTIQAITAVTGGC